MNKGRNEERKEREDLDKEINKQEIKRWKGRKVRKG